MSISRSSNRYLVSNTFLLYVDPFKSNLRCIVIDEGKMLFIIVNLKKKFRRRIKIKISFFVDKKQVATYFLKRTLFHIKQLFMKLIC